MCSETLLIIYSTSKTVFRMKKKVVNMRFDGFILHSNGAFERLISEEEQPEATPLLLLLFLLPPFLTPLHLSLPLLPVSLSSSIHPRFLSSAAGCDRSARRTVTGTSLLSDGDGLKRTDQVPAGTSRTPQEGRKDSRCRRCEKPEERTQNKGARGKTREVKGPLITCC